VIVQEIFPNERTINIDVAEPDFGAVKSWYPKIHGTRFNFVLNPNQSKSISSDTVSDELDRFFLKLIRSQSDLIITTGETARSENLRASRLAPFAIITRHPNSLDIPATNTTSQMPVIICSTSELETKYLNSSLSYFHLKESDFAAAVSAVIENLGATSVVVETGLSAAANLFKSGAIDELCLTVVDAKDRNEASLNAQLFYSELNIRVEMIQLLVSKTTFLFRFKVLK